MNFKLAKIIDQNSFQNFWLTWWNVYYGSECILAWGVFFKVREDSISALACYIWWAPQTAVMPEGEKNLGASKVEKILEQREVAFLSPSKICEIWIFLLCTFKD